MLTRSVHPLVPRASAGNARPFIACDSEDSWQRALRAGRRVGAGVCLVVGVAIVALTSGGVKEAAARRATRPTVRAKAPAAEAKAPELPPLPAGPVYLNDERGTPNVLVYPARRASASPRPPP
ncbi:MAG: hypothetical protein IPI67_00780 [Myxococcales bacterium]|nr:hypothetical protein [Myxococcales bacterium]